MNIVPIAFAFDNNLVMPACVCISSLLMNAKEDTFYDIFILHSASVELEKEGLNRIPQYYVNCQIHYVAVDNCFENSFEIRDITTPTYYRLLISDLIPQYDKIIYSDVDIIFRSDLSDLYRMDISTSYITATYDLGMNLTPNGQKYINSLHGLKQGEYIQAGFLLINSDLIRRYNLTERFKEEAKKNYKFQDQDILNIVCGDLKSILPIRYNMTDYTFSYLIMEPESLSKYVSSDEIDEARNLGTLHFNGHKPWKKYCVNFDIWWEYYRKSPFFDERFYFDFFYNKLDELDQLSLWKRIKILVRYFVYGRKRS